MRVNNYANFNTLFNILLSFVNSFVKYISLFRLMTIIIPIKSIPVPGCTAAECGVHRGDYLNKAQFIMNFSNIIQ